MSLIVQENDRDSEPVVLHVQQPGATVLPGIVASGVSAATGISSVTLKLGSKVAGFWIGAARETTLASLELTRAGVEVLLTTAGRDVTRRSTSEIGRQEAAGILERSVCPAMSINATLTDLVNTQIAALHSTIGYASFIASSGFHLGSATVDSFSSVSLQGLSTLNAILGSTESSRAVAAIIALIKNELNKPGSDETEVVGYLDLVVGIVAFVLLQRWGKRKTELDFRLSGGEEVIWDTVLDDKGFRADVVGTKRKDYSGVPPISIETSQGPGAMSFLSPMGDEEIEAFERGTIHETANVSLSPQDQTQLSDEQIREHIMGQLPDGARAVVTSQTITAKTIKVDIYDSPMTDVAPPPGTVMIAERYPHSERPQADGLPQQTVVFRTSLKRSSSADIEPTDRLRISSAVLDEMEATDNDDMIVLGPPASKTQQNVMERTDSMEIDERQVSADTSHTNACAEHARTTAPSAPPVPAVPANQKKSRRPALRSTASEVEHPSPPSKPSFNRLTSRTRLTNNKKADEDGRLKKALKSLSPSQSSSAVKDLAGQTGRREPPRNLATSSIPRLVAATPRTQNLQQDVQQKRSHTPLTDANLLAADLNRSPSKQSYYSVHEKRRDSLVSETYSTHAVESRPGSPTFSRTHARSSSGLQKTRSEVGIAFWNGDGEEAASPAAKHHQRSKSFVPSLYSMATKGSEEALILVPKVPERRHSVFDDHETLVALVQDGKIAGMFPKNHMVHNIRRFARFSSASYGSNFLRIMGMAPGSGSRKTDVQTLDIHHEHDSFSNHTGLPPDTILLSSFMDPQGVGTSTGDTRSVISPLVHFVSVDHESKAVVLTCRGTLGFEDLLTDMLCDYDDLHWQGQKYQVHKGIHASARRLLGSSGIMATLRASLEEYEDYGLVLTGHSLGGAVAAVLAVLASEPSTIEQSGALFVTAAQPKLLSQAAYQASSVAPPVTLPAGRPIHVYSYGTPASFSEPLRLATRGLITTIINSADIFPSLSLGTLHDFKSVAVNLRNNRDDAFIKFKERLWSRMIRACQTAFYVDSGPPPLENIAGDGIGEDNWAWAALKTFRATMSSDKLVPPGEIFVVESTRVFDRQTSASAAVPDTATERVFKSLGRPATRVQLKLIRDVEGRFGELRFGRSMFSDHTPGRYEASLAALEKGILEL